MPRKRVSALACGLAGSIAFASAAPAAGAVATHPKAGTYSQSKHGSYEMEFTLDKGRVRNAIHYDDCVTVPIMMPNIKVTKGRFSYDGTRKNVLSTKFKVHVDGHFVTKKKAKGTWTARSKAKGHCTSSYQYTVVRTGPVPS